MKKIKTATAAMVLSALSFGVFAADNTQPANDVNSPIGIAKASDVVAGSNIAPGTQAPGYQKGQMQISSSRLSYY